MAMTVIAIGVVLMVQPWWKLGFQVGFFVTLIGIVAQIVTGHVAAAGEKRSAP
jgi:hypothetical protein